MVAGAVVAVDRHYFQNTGAYDSDMTTWGAENLELSIRVRTLIKHQAVVTIGFLRKLNKKARSSL